MDINMDTEATGPFSPLAHTIIRYLHARPHACAIRFRGASISNAMLLNKVLELATDPRLADLSRGTRVGVCLERGPETPALLLALWWRGAVYVPLDPSLPRERLFAMCELADLELLVTQASLRARMESLPCALLVLEIATFDSAQSLRATPFPKSLPGPDVLAYILFTSGSSGRPKGVKVTHGNIVALFAAVLPLLDLTRDSRILGCANFSFDISFFELLAPLLCGGTLILADSAACAAPLQLLQLVEGEQVTVLQATPSHWQLLNALPWTVSLNVAIATGEALLRDTAADILRHTDVLWNLYGPTECTLWASAQRVTAEDLEESAPAAISIGRALPGYGLQLEAMHAQEDPGSELVIAGPGVSVGYCGDWEDRAFENRPGGRVYRTGDLCRYDAHGRLHFLGRADNQVKHNGYRIELDEIALLLRQHMSVREAVCLVRPARGDAPSLLFACVVFRPGMPNRNKTALNAFLATALPPWMLPQRYFFLDALPLTVNGKLDRLALLALTTPAHAPDLSGKLEAQVAGVFCEVLDLPSIGPCDSFLDAGGSSMLAATLVLTLNERLGSSITLRQALATPPTVNSIVQLLERASAAS
jgi:amino acid adenylation domain-containing protein